jgi:hypothetical protein
VEGYVLEMRVQRCESDSEGHIMGLEVKTKEPRRVTDLCYLGQDA